MGAAKEPTIALGDHPHLPLGQTRQNQGGYPPHRRSNERSDGYIERDPRALGLVEFARIRTMLLAPMLQEGMS